MSFHTSIYSFYQDPVRAYHDYNILGYHIERNVFTDECIKTLIDEAHGFPAAKDGIYKPIMHPHRINAHFLNALKNEKITHIISKLIGGKKNKDVFGLQTEFFFCRPGTPGFSAHQDNFYVQAPPDAFVSAWCALDFVDRENGGLYIYPKSHQEPLLEVEETNIINSSVHQDPNAHRIQSILPTGKYEKVDLTLEPGTVVFLHGHTVHGSNSNTSNNRYRNALLCTYIREGEPFRPGSYSKREPVSLKD